jgi:hypothetical protein
MEANRSPSGAFVDAKGNDIYTKRRAAYYFFMVLQIIYLAAILANFVLIMNATVKHTHTYENNNGPLYSERYDSMYWFALMFSACRIFLFITLCSVLLYRKTSCCCGGRNNRYCSNFWIFLLLCFVVIDVFVLATLGSFFSGCNVPGNANNPCNDLRYCHVPEVYNNPDSGCTYMTAWLPPVTQGELRRDRDFIWMFSVSVAFVAFDCVFLMVPLGMWLNNTTTQAHKKNDDDDDDDDIYDEEELDFDVLQTEEQLALLGGSMPSLRQQQGGGTRKIRQRIKKAKQRTAVMPK